MPNPILCLDFDGVLHSYSSGWEGADVISDPPVDGAMEFIFDALKCFRVAIFSSRSNQPGGVQAMKKWLKTHFTECFKPMSVTLLLDDIEWPLEKPPAMVTIDYRALTFNGTWPSIDSLIGFQPWNKHVPVQFNELVSTAKDVLGQLFLDGPTSDGDIATKQGRNELCDLHLAEHAHGWTYLTREGVILALVADVKSLHDKRWYRKQQDLPP
jgi:hypothetical protein